LLFGLFTQSVPVIAEKYMKSKKNQEKSAKIMFLTERYDCGYQVALRA